MIFDQKDNLLQYKGLSKSLDCAIEYLLHTDFTAMLPGKYPVRGEDVFALIQTPQTVERDRALWESHRQYIDIQYLLSGHEQIGLQNMHALQASTAYDPQKDIQFYNDNGQGFFVSLAPDSYVFCFPADVHRPLICVSQPETIKKVVMKVRTSDKFNPRETRT